jgi:hypothetical protein
MPRQRFVPCLAPGCGELVTTTTRGRRCKRHRQQLEQARGSRQARGYGAEHDARRRELAPIVEAGQARCSRCGELIAPGSAWDLGHDDDDRARYAGPEHQACNRGTAGRTHAPRTGAHGGGG